MAGHPVARIMFELSDNAVARPATSARQRPASMASARRPVLLRRHPGRTPRRYGFDLMLNTDGRDASCFRMESSRTVTARVRRRYAVRSSPVSPTLCRTAARAEGGPDQILQVCREKPSPLSMANAGKTRTARRYAPDSYSRYPTMILPFSLDRYLSPALAAAFSCVLPLSPRSSPACPLLFAARLTADFPASPGQHVARQDGRGRCLRERVR
jgi:hypothetical protein